MGEKNEVQVAFSEQLTDKLCAVGAALPKDFNRTRFVQNCLTVLNENPQLSKINRAAVIQGLCKAAYLGLDFMNKECYLIPYGSTVQFQTDYKGEIKFVKRYAIRPIHDIYAKLVREGDSFEENIVDGHPSIDFKPLPFSNREIVGVFAVALFKDGGLQYETMTKDEVQNTRNVYSKAKNSSAWKDSWGEMAKKTVLRRLCKHIETDFESVEARQVWEEASDMQVVQKMRDPDELVNPFDQPPVEVEFSEVAAEEIPIPDVFK